jgi:hypothetical protein
MRKVLGEGWIRGGFLFGNDFDANARDPFV